MKTGEMICLNLSAVWGLKAYLLVKPGCVWGRERLRRTVPTLRNDAGGGRGLVQYAHVPKRGRVYKQH